MRKHIAITLAEFLNEQNNPDEYTGFHPAPSKEDSDPMHDVSTTFPDMYNDDAIKYYGGYDLDDGVVIRQIQSVHNKPNAIVKIYRAVPYLNKEIDKTLKSLNSVLNYYNKYNFFPQHFYMSNKVIKPLYDKYKNLKWHEWDSAIIKDIEEQREKLLQQKNNPIKINDGDWVTTSEMYAKEHGERVLDNTYKIVTKTVKASQLYTNGDSIFEWAYHA